MTEQHTEPATPAAEGGHEDDEGYTGPATLRIDDRELPVRVRLLAVFEPVDGRMHWAGRVATDPALHELLGGRSSPVELRTPQGSAAGGIGEPDPWGRYRVSGAGPPPFREDPVSLDD
ncbi:MAG TPA: DUF4873 domain-containing protein [Pseudonocardia sp.]|jgi:hypothetical protein